MKTFNVSAVARMFVLVLSLFAMPLAAPVVALAQNTTSTQEGGGASATQTTRTTTTTQTRSTWLDPFWLVLGGVALLAIILIIVLASRGRGRDRTAVVHERETVVKKE